MALLSQTQAESLPRVNSTCSVLLCTRCLESSWDAMSLIMGSFPSAEKLYKAFVVAINSLEENRNIKHVFGKRVQKSLCLDQGRLHLARRSSQGREDLQQDGEKGSAPECQWPQPEVPAVNSANQA